MCLKVGFIFTDNNYDKSLNMAKETLKRDYKQMKYTEPFCEDKIIIKINDNNHAILIYSVKDSPLEVKHGN